jgi:hypothetical protein
MAVVNTHEAKTNFSRFLDEVQEGKEVVIARGNRWRDSFPTTRRDLFAGPSI